MTGRTFGKGLAALALFACTAFAEGKPVPSPSDRLLDAIAVVESGNRPDAIGDAGKAVGAYQLWKCYVSDVNRICKARRNGLAFSDGDRLDAAKSRRMARIYLEWYGERYTRKTGQPPTDEVFARIHNGGPDGYRKKCTALYWRKISKALKK